MADADAQPLLAQQPNGAMQNNNNALKYGSLMLVIVQNSAHVLLLRYSRIPNGNECSLYVTSVAVLFSEILKLVVCLVMLVVTEGGVVAAASMLKHQIWDRKYETLKLGIPSVCYTFQNNMQFVAASHLGAALLQLLYQMKTLTTAIFGVIILGKTLRCNQWLALIILVCGVVLAQGSQHAEGSDNGRNMFIGVMAALGVSVASGFASVYLEKILKGDKTPLLVRNVQLCIFSIPLQFLAIWQRDYRKVTTKGWLYGFCPVTWAVVCMFAFGGLLVAVVIRFADNNLKNLAMALAILVSCGASVPLFGFVPNRVFAMGATLVIASIFMYAWQPQKPQSPTAYISTTDVDVSSQSSKV